DPLERRVQRLRDPRGVTALERRARTLDVEPFHGRSVSGRGGRLGSVADHKSHLSTVRIHYWSRTAGRAFLDGMFQRDLCTRTDTPVSALGLGCWAIGGPYTAGGRPAGWGEVDDDESIRAIRRAVELGVTLFDTADAYGAGHSERVLGRALA